MTREGMIHQVSMSKLDLHIQKHQPVRVQHKLDARRGLAHRSGRWKAAVRRLLARCCTVLEKPLMQA